MLQTYWFSGDTGAWPRQSRDSTGGLAGTAESMRRSRGRAFHALRVNGWLFWLGLHPEVHTEKCPRHLELKQEPRSDDACRGACWMSGRWSSGVSPTWQVADHFGVPEEVIGL